MKRCNRLIVVVSKNFLESNHKKYITNYAQALGIGEFYNNGFNVLIYLYSIYRTRRAQNNSMFN